MKHHKTIAIFAFLTAALFAAPQAQAGKIWDSLSDECKKQIRNQIGNERSAAGATNHHTQGGVKLLLEIQEGRRDLEDECGILLRRGKDGRYRISWAPWVEEIDWK